MSRRSLLQQAGALPAIRRGEPGVYVCPTDVTRYEVYLAVGAFHTLALDGSEGETWINLRHLDGSDARAMAARDLHALRRAYENPDPDTADDRAAMRELGRASRSDA